MHGNREYHIDSETCAALQTNTGVRFLLRAKLALESRHSSDIIPWARNLSEKTARAIAEAAGRPLRHFAIQVNAIRLMSERPYALICYDLFLHERDEQTRSQFSQTPLQPIHEVVKRGSSCHVFRSRKMDSVVAGQYKRMQECDNGPRPYFADSRYPPLYVDGRRVERSKDGTPDPDEPEGWDWERGLVFATEEDQSKEDREGDKGKEDVEEGRLTEGRTEDQLEEGRDEGRLMKDGTEDELKADGKEDKLKPDSGKE